MRRKYLGLLTWFAFLAVVASLTLLAKRAGWGERLHPVGGQLVWENGQPARELVGCMIYFESLEHHSISRSRVKEDGSFQLTTEKPEARGTDGAPPGHHRVYLSDERRLLESRFRSPETSDLEVTVPPGGPVVLRLERNHNQAQVRSPE
jgi:hypothetical protein